MPAGRGRHQAALLLLAASTAACETSGGSLSRESGEWVAADSLSANTAGDLFVDRAAEAGLDFVHFNGASGRFYYPEILPPGVALLDYDNDGDLDAYLVQRGRLDPEPAATGAAVALPDEHAPSGGRLFRNDLAPDPDPVRIEDR